MDIANVAMHQCGNSSFSVERAEAGLGFFSPFLNISLISVLCGECMAKGMSVWLRVRTLSRGICL